MNLLSKDFVKPTERCRFSLIKLAGIFIKTQTKVNGFYDNELINKNLAEFLNEWIYKKGDACEKFEN